MDVKIEVGKEVSLEALTESGFVFARIFGSNMIYKNPESEDMVLLKVNGNPKKYIVSEFIPKVYTSFPSMEEYDKNHPTRKP